MKMKIASTKANPSCTVMTANTKKSEFVSDFAKKRSVARFV